jgi:hypothetical protein
MDRYDVLLALGLIIASVGIGLLSVPAGMIALGAGMAGIGVLGAAGIESRRVERRIRRIADGEGKREASPNEGRL